ncbi:ribbon-helix-helix protein, CopG family [Candidatus Bathyarchaeota archaeon A05DMB-2]|jgi:selenophosphate synthetase-related protein|nr:ribbon-helix-helix protein, CopG family [Candidatus Bathyarchaeota archaeon A05DMB-2]
MKVTNVRLTDKIVQSIDKLARKHDLTRSEVIRQALIVYLHLVENVGTMLRPVAFQVKPAQIIYTRRGDVTILGVPTGHSIVVGSTSSGAVGPKPMDEVKVDGRVLGKFMARVALMDVAATGAFPILLSVTLGVEKEPTGKQILEGIRGEARVVGLDPNQVLMENTEDNFETVQTGAGLTVVGFVNTDELRLGKTSPGDLIVAVGKPKVGDEVLPAEARGEIADLRNVISLSQKKYVHDIAPVGTLGIAYEARMMAHAVGKQLKLEEVQGLDLNKSAGPATVILATINREKLDELTMLLNKPVTVIGEIL